jgi:hypothetical protein
MSEVVVMVGTRKGAFFCRSDANRRQWKVEGPHFKGWDVGYLQLDTRSEPTLYAGVGHFVYGPSIQISKDFGATWTQVENSPRYAADAGREVQRIWCIEPGRGDQPQRLYAGVDEAGLFVTDDGGLHWKEVPGLNDHPTRPGWSPGAGGLCCHRVVVDEEKPGRLWVGISAVGVFRSDDDGESWAACNQGAPIVVPSQEFPGIGSCVHSLVRPGGRQSASEVLFQQNHRGVFRSDDGATTWKEKQQGLPSTFGFPMVAHPREPKTLFTVPLESDEYRTPTDGHLEVYRTVDGGDSWQPVGTGLPEGGCYTAVLRHAFDADGLDPLGLYLGTTGGRLHYSADGGETWDAMPCSLPRIQSVKAVVLGGGGR